MAVAGQVAQVFRQAGISPAGTAGIIGNFQQESSLDPSRAGGLLGQWQGPRYQALQSFAQQQGRSVTDPVVQAQFTVQELKTQYPALYGMLRTTNDPRAAALAVSQQYERPGVPMNQNRVSYALSAFRQLGGGGGGGSGGGGFPAATGPAGSSSSIQVPYTTQNFDRAGYNQAQRGYIAGSFLKSPGANPFGGNAGLSSLFQAGRLSSAPPNVQDFVSQQTHMQQIATGQLQQIAGVPLVNAHQGAAGDVNPIPGAVIGRTDMGVDANLKPGAPILAPNDGKVVAISPNWYKGQPYVAIQLTSGPNRGKVMYVAEQITGVPRVGQTVRRGQPIARYAPSGTGIEIGWANPSSPTQTLAQATTGYSEGQQTRAGTNFRSYLGGL